MRVVAIKTPKTQFEQDAIDQMHRVRARVFRDRLHWNVSCDLGRERDEFDALNPTYILALGEYGEVIGCARLLPATGLTMLGTVFPQLLQSGHLPWHQMMVESSRFCVETGVSPRQAEGSLHAATRAMFAGIVEWSIGNGFTEIVTVTDVRFERILSRAGWQLRRLGAPVLIDETLSVAGILPADRSSFEKLRPPAYSSQFGVLTGEAV